LVEPCRNHSNSTTTDRTCTFFVVNNGNPADRSNRIWWPKTLRVPVPVRSVLTAPVVRMRSIRSRYCCIPPA
jgi:hypothetical protein